MIEKCWSFLVFLILFREEEIEDITKTKEEELRKLEETQQKELEKWKEELEQLRKERDELKARLEELQARRQALEKELEEQKRRDPEVEAQVNPDAKDGDKKNDDESAQKSVTSALSLQRTLTKGFFKDYEPISNFDSHSQVRGVEFSFNGLYCFVSTATRIIRYEQKIHGKTEKLEKVKELELDGVQSMKTTEAGDIAVVTFHDGKNILCYYNSALEKLQATEVRGSGNIEKCSFILLTLNFQLAGQTHSGLLAMTNSHCGMIQELLLKSQTTSQRKFIRQQTMC